MMMVVPAPGTQRQISRTVLALLIAGAIVAVVPHLLRLWTWLWLVGGVAIGWAVMVQLGRWQPPSGWVKGALAFGGLLGVLWSSRGQMSLDAAVGILLVAYQLKLIETQRQRDGFVVVFMAYFVIATWFLFDQTLPSALWGFVATLLASAALVAQNQSLTRVRPVAALRTSIVLGVLAAPLAGIVFLMFPRVAPLWSVEMPSSGRTGLSERVDPTSIASLAKDPAVAFRVTFEGEPPPQAALYWRGINYYAYDNREWRQGNLVGVPLPELVDFNDDREVAPWARHEDVQYRYQVVMEATGRRWLFALGNARGVGGRIGTTRDLRLLNRDDVKSTFAYRATTATGGGDMPDWMRTAALQLPARGNERTRRLGSYLRSLHADDAGFTSAVLGYFRERGFTYSLTPGGLPEADGIDAFMFGTRRGFCAHFATAMVYLLRVGGVPARLVGGYLGGEVNPIGGFMTVRQYHAHAWVEAWLPGRGWTRLDPTGVVVPERIAGGVQALSDEAEGALPGPWDVRGMTGLAGLFATLDSVEHRWNMWVVGYDAGTQARILGDWLGGNDWRRVGALMLSAVGALLVGWLLGGRLLRAWRAWQAFSPARGLERWGAARGHPRAPDEPLAAYGERLAAALPSQRARIRAFVDECYSVLYVPGGRAGLRLWRRLLDLHLPAAAA